MARFEGRRLSWTRVLVLFVGATALLFVSFSGWRWFQDARASEGDDTAFAGYVDVAVTPHLDFETPVSAAARNVVLSFVVASPDADCAPSWGRDYSLDDAANDLDLDRRIARLRQNKGDISVSFGGAANSELATVCTDERALLKAYRSVVERYDVRSIDLDLEGAALSNASASARRARVLGKLQEERAKKNKDLEIWLTLPVAPDGLSMQGRETVSTTLQSEVTLSGINVMTMDYGESRPKSQSMGDAAIAALKATHRQLRSIYSQANKAVGPATLWTRMGATPMVGQNDIAGEIFSIADAQQLNAFARDKSLGRLSMWSLNRDRTCGANFPDVRVVSNSCSGIDQGDLTFAQILSRGLHHSAEPSSNKSPKPAQSLTPQAVPSDDPAKSPYPIWDPDQTYVEGTRIVIHRNVYAAKWWTQGDVPDDPTVDQVSSPWTLLGPVLPGEKPAVVTKLPAGTYPQWDTKQVYTSGQRVMFDGLAFSAKWWTQGDIPAERSSQADPSPWIQLTEAQLRKAANRGQNSTPAQPQDNQR